MVRARAWAAVAVAGCATARAEVHEYWQAGMLPKLEGIYCADDNCYELLGVPGDADSAAIKKRYRTLAVEYHPDKNPSESALKHFQKIARAYEVLSDAGQRRAYDWGLENPQIFARHMAQFKPPRYTPKSDPALILVVCALVISALHYAYRGYNFKRGCDKLKRTPAGRRRYEEILTEELTKAGAKEPDALAAKIAAAHAAEATGKASAVGKGAKKAAKNSAAMYDETARAAADVATERLLAEVDVDGNFVKPDWTDTPVVWIVTSPYRFAAWLWWYVRWLVKFDINGEPYGPEEIEYLTMKALQLTKGRWHAFSEEKRADLCEKELWVPENFEHFYKKSTGAADGKVGAKKQKKRALMADRAASL